MAIVSAARLRLRLRLYKEHHRSRTDTSRCTNSPRGLFTRGATTRLEDPPAPGPGFPPVPRAPIESQKGFMKFDLSIVFQSYEPSALAYARNELPKWRSLRIEPTNRVLHSRVIIRRPVDSFEADFEPVNLTPVDFIKNYSLR